MEQVFRLNAYDVRKNPLAGCHDPSLMYDPVSKRYFSYCTDIFGDRIGVCDRIGIPARSSPDLVHFTYHGSVLSQAAIDQGRDNGPDHRPTWNFWAPFCEYVRGEYRLYYSATKAFGSSESRIWLATAKDPLGPFENRGVVADTWGTDDTLPNAIDPHILWEGDQCWLVYGSFFGGIYIKALDPATGLAAGGDPRELGICISRKAPKPRIDGPEGAAVIFVPEEGYYYLFQSYGWLGDTYDIRVGRSRRATGPYLDLTGEDMVEKALGTKLAGSYRFTASAPAAGTEDEGWQWDGFRGPGHGVPFFDPVGKGYYFMHHIRDGASVNAGRDPHEGRLSFRRHYGMIRPMFFLKGWPVLGPEPFAGEDLTRVSPPAGKWELIFFEDDHNDIRPSVFADLGAEDPLLTGGRCQESPDYENGGSCLTLTGIDQRGIAYWGKFHP